MPTPYLPELNFQMGAVSLESSPPGPGWEKSVAKLKMFLVAPEKTQQGAGRKAEKAKALNWEETWLRNRLPEDKPCPAVKILLGAPLQRASPLLMRLPANASTWVLARMRSWLLAASPWPWWAVAWGGE